MTVTFEFLEEWCDDQCLEVARDRFCATPDFCKNIPSHMLEDGGCCKKCVDKWALQTPNEPSAGLSAVIVTRWFDSVDELVEWLSDANNRNHVEEVLEIGGVHA